MEDRGWRADNMATRVNEPGDCVAPQSQVHGGHAPSSRLVGGPFLMEQQDPQYFNGLLAQKKFSCPSCGGEAQWNPEKKAIICPFCGTVSPAQAELNPTGKEVIVEHVLVAALR